MSRNVFLTISMSISVKIVGLILDAVFHFNSMENFSSKEVFAESNFSYNKM